MIELPYDEAQDDEAFNEIMEFLKAFNTTGRGVVTSGALGEPVTRFDYVRRNLRILQSHTLVLRQAKLREGVSDEASLHEIKRYDEILRIAAQQLAAMEVHH